MTRTLGSAVGVVLAACALQGCLASTVVLQVKPDGSGTAVATVQVNRVALQDFEKALGSPMGPVQLEDRYPRPDNRALETFFGTRVTLVSSTLTPNADGFARETTVAFDDVTKIQLPFPPFVGSMSEGFHVSSSFGSPLITFAIQPHENGDRLLIVRMPDSPIDQRPEPEPDPHPLTAAEQQEQALLKRAARGGAVHLLVELDTTLLRTNAPARDGNRATILDVDFSKVLNGPAFENTVPTPSPLSVQELLWNLGDTPGVVTPAEREVFLEFEPPTQSAPPPSQAPARPAAPDTEVYLAPLTISGEHITVGQPVNISNSPGYDNQPSFTPDGQRLFFTSARGGAQTDIYRYELATKRITQLTNTPESEYSPTATPDHGLSVVRVEADGTQRLWRFTSDGRDPRVLLESVKPVGYYAWSDEHTVALYILGQAGTNQPSTLQLADTRTNNVRSIATDIGRSVLAMPGAQTISFVQRSVQGEKTTLSIKALDPATGAVRPLTAAVDGTTEVNAAWMADGTLLTIQNDHLFAWRRGADGWIEVVSLDRLGLRGATRLAVSPDSHWVAIVGSPQ